MVGLFSFFLISSNSGITQQGSHGRANINISSRKMSNYTCPWHQISEKRITDNKDLSDLVQECKISACRWSSNSPPSCLHYLLLWNSNHLTHNIFYNYLTLSNIKDFSFFELFDIEGPKWLWEKHEFNVRI